MKKLTPLLFLLIAINISCGKDNETTADNDLIGTWKLTEILSDPGDGSGTYNPVESNRILTFNTNGSVTSNGSFCNMGIETGTWDSANWSLSDSSITVSDCYTDQFSIRFELSENIIELYYPCIEPCGMKFVKD